MSKLLFLYLGINCYNETIILHIDFVGIREEFIILKRRENNVTEASSLLPPFLETSALARLRTQQSLSPVTKTAI